MMGVFGRRVLLSSVLASSFGAVLGLGALGGAGCAEDPSITDLEPAGPPSVRQLLVDTNSLDEQCPIACGGTFPGGPQPLGLAAGEHELINDCDPAGNCPDGFTCDNVGNFPHCRDANGNLPGVQHGMLEPPIEIHAVFKELLAGASVEQFICLCQGDPATATSEDPTLCDTSNGSAYTDNPFDCSGCADTNPASGVGGQCVDDDQNGLPDLSALFQGVAHVACGTSFSWDSDVSSGYYAPAGSQVIPVADGLSGLGPALVLDIDTLLPADSDCTLSLPGGANGPITDKDGNALVDPSFALTWHTDTIGLVDTTPEDMSTGVPDSTRTVTATFDTLLDASSVTASSVTFTPPVTGITVGLTASSANAGGNDTISIKIPASPNGLQAGTMYTVSISGITDTFGSALTTPVSFSFTMN